MPKTLAKRVSNGFGLLDDSQTKYLNGLALGWLPNFEVAGSVNTINNAIDKPMSVIGDYVCNLYRVSFPYSMLTSDSVLILQVQIYALEDEVPTPLIQVDYHLANVSTGNPNVQPVYHISLMPQGKRIDLYNIAMSAMDIN